MQEIINSDNILLWHLIGAIAFLLIGNTICGIARAKDESEFDWKILKKGIVKYLLIFIALICFFCSGLLLPNEIHIPVLDIDITILKILELIAFAICGKYIYAMWLNFKVLFDLSEEDLKPRNDDDINDGGVI